MNGPWTVDSFNNAEAEVILELVDSVVSMNADFSRHVPHLFRIYFRGSQLGFLLCQLVSWEMLKTASLMDKI